VVTVEVVDAWESNLEDLFAHFAGRFARVETRWRAFAYIRGLLAPLERKNGWTLAEHAGNRSPNGLQAMLQSPCWDADAVRDDVRYWALAHLAHEDAVLVADETGFLKKGKMSAGVQRQYSGTAGRTENCQIGTFLTYASPSGRTLIDRELYLPKSWTNDRDRCRAAAIPDEVAFATKPEQARMMLQRALEAGVLFQLVHRRRGLRAKPTPTVVAGSQRRVLCDGHPQGPAGAFRTVHHQPPGPHDRQGAGRGMETPLLRGRGARPADL